MIGSTVGDIRNACKNFIQKVMLDRFGDLDLREIFIRAFG